MNKIKSFIESQKGKDILTVIMIVLVGLSSFGLGRLSKSSSNNGIRIEYNDKEATVLGATSQNKPQMGQITPKSTIPQNTPKMTNSGEYFASSRGKKYYSINCSAGKTIKIENRIYFETTTQAEEAGYELSSSCK